MKPNNIVSKIVVIIVLVVELILGLRFLVKLLGAKNTGIFELIYDVSGKVLSPFSGRFGDWEITSGFIVEWDTLLAMIAYAIIGIVLVKIINMVADAMG